MFNAGAVLLNMNQFLKIELHLKINIYQPLACPPFCIEITEKMKYEVTHMVNQQEYVGTEVKTEKM